jgi:hypothetical protein
LYFGTVAGFNTATGPELALAQCEANSGTINTALAFEKFVRLPSVGPNAVNGGAPFCEDFNEQLICPNTTSNVNGCATNGAVGLPTVTTACGNGTVDAFEECDPNAARGAWSCNQVSGSCSTTCRCG